MTDDQWDMFYAIHEDDLKTAQKLLAKFAEQRVDMNLHLNQDDGTGQTPLKLALYYSPQIAELFLQYGAEIKRRDLKSVICSGNVKATEVLLRYGANIYDDERLFFDAVLVCGSVKMVKLLLKHGAKPNCSTLFLFSLLI